MSIYWPFAAPLFVVVVLTIMTRVSPMRRAAIVLFLNWLVISGFVLLTSVYDPWLFFIVIDAVAAWVVLYPPAGRVQAVIGGLLMSQIMVHAIYGASKFFNPETVSPDAYLQLLDVLGFLQLILLGGWAGGHWFGAAHRAWNRHRARMVGRQSPHGLA